MRQHQFKSVILLLCLVFSLVWPSAVDAAATRTIADFLELESKWDQFAKSGTQLKLVGRYSLVNRKRMTFLKCKLMFLPKTLKGFPNVTGSSRRAEVIGRLKKKQGKLVFIVSKFRQLPSDKELYLQRQEKIPKGTSEGWFKLGDWVRDRSVFYDDKELLKLAQTSYREGIKVEHKNLSPNDFAGMMRLVQKVDKHKLPNEFRQELVHEAYRVEWKLLQKEKQPDYSSIIQRVASHMTGALDVLPAPQPKLEQRYNDDPLEVFRASGIDARKRLHRIFFSEIVLQSIESNVNVDGSNGYEIAARIDENIPEKHELAEKFRDRELDFKLTEIDVYTQQEAITLSKQFRERGRPEKARQIRNRWLAARLEKVPPNDIEAILQISEQYEALLEDKETAHKILLEAYKEHPESKELAAALKRLGFSLKDGKWLSPKEVDGLPVDPIALAIREGRIAIGMTAKQVLSSQGRPSSITKIVTVGKVSELWIYRDRGTTRITVHLIRSTRPPAEGAKVVSSF